jgi:hypothetical protein
MTEQTNPATTATEPATAALDDVAPMRVADGGDAQVEPGALAQYFAVLVEHCLNQNDMMWNRTQLLIAVQGAVIAGAYFLFSKQPILARCMLAAGATLTALIGLLAIEDRQDRDANLELIREVDDKLQPRLGLRHEDSFRFARRSRGLRWADGDWLLIAIFAAFFLTNIALAFTGFETADRGNAPVTTSVHIPH